MHDNLTELPEAIPLHRVSPAWRLLAILAIIITVLCLIGILSMSVQIHMLQMQQSNRPVPWTPPPMAPAAVAVPVVVNVPADKKPIDPANLPYPIHEDLRHSLGFAIAPAEAGPTIRERFLRLGKEYWKCPPDWSVSTLAVAPDGVSLAIFNGSKLLNGPFNNLREIEEPVKVGPGSQPNPPPTVRREPSAGSRLVGHPSWSIDSRYVYFATAAGKLKRFDTQQQLLETLPFRGQWPTPWPNDPTKFLFVRAQPAPKLDPAGGDLTELIAGTITSKAARVLVKASRAQWAYPVFGPRGKQIAVWSTLGQESTRYQLVLIDATSGATSPVEGITTSKPGPIAWLPDEPVLVYERAIDPPLPADCLAMEAHPVPNRSAGIFQYDLDKKTETRLSRGGGIGSPSVDKDGDLHHVGWQWQVERDRNTMRLYRVPLASVRKFAGNFPPLPIRDVAGWTALIEQVCEDAPLPAGQGQPNADVLARLAEAFAARYPERFRELPPPGPAGFNRQLAELRDLKLPAEVRPRLLLVLAAVHGEYLRKQHGAMWHIADAAAAAGSAENEFAQAVGFFAFLEHSLTDPAAPSLDELLRQAAGRTLVLTNNPAAAKAKLAEMIDPDLPRGTAILQKGKPADAEKVFSAMLQREPNRRNHFLALQVGRQLYEHNRLPAVEAIMERIADQPPADPQTFNLLGLAVLERDPRGAINAFKKSLRCDLHFGPAYLNLALAYQQAGDTPSAVSCLKRYLELLPSGPLASDAARQLAELEEGNGGK